MSGFSEGRGVNVGRARTCRRSAAKGSMRMWSYLRGRVNLPLYLRPDSQYRFSQLGDWRWRVTLSAGEGGG
jgi:hypothetical protein